MDLDTHNQMLTQHYFTKINILITEILEREEKSYVHEGTLFGDDSTKNIRALEIAFKIRQKQMKEGDIAQITIGNFPGWEDLGQGHPSGLDCRKKNNHIIMEVKNKWNTCNSGSQKALLDKLSKYKKENPYTRCIWAVVNPKRGCRKLYEKFIYDGVELEKIQGSELMKLVFTMDAIDYSNQVIEYVRRTMYANCDEGD